MPQVDGKEHSARHNVSRIGKYLDHPDAADSERPMRTCNGLDAIDQPCCPEQGVLAQVHRRRTSMGLPPFDCDFEPAHPLHVSNNADLLPLGFEQRPLLDVELEECRERMCAAALGPAIANSFERLTKRNP